MTTTPREYAEARLNNQPVPKPEHVWAKWTDSAGNVHCSYSEYDPTGHLKSKVTYREDLAVRVIGEDA